MSTRDRLMATSQTTPTYPAAGSRSEPGKPPKLGTGPTYLKDVTWHLVRRDFATRHRGSLLGWLWALAPPLLQLLVTYFLFTKVLPLRVQHYPVFLLTGILSWNWFTRSLSLGTISLESQRELVLRPGFPTSVLPVTAGLIGLVDYLLALPILLIAVGFSTGLHPTALLLPLILAIQLVLTIGIAWALAPLQVFFRDVQYLVGLLLMLGFWLTPIFYSRVQVPSQFAWLYNLNPMAHLIEADREILLAGHLPSQEALGLVALASIGMAAAGYTILHRFRHSIPDQL
jgi:lipopolysaccharide transport system permease protein